MVLWVVDAGWYQQSFWYISKFGVEESWLCCQICVRLLVTVSRNFTVDISQGFSFGTGGIIGWDFQARMFYDSVGAVLKLKTTKTFSPMSAVSNQTLK
jgi:hypothetical protein